MIDFIKVNKKEKFNISEKINLEKEFLISLYRIKGGEITLKKNLKIISQQNQIINQKKKLKSQKNLKKKEVNQLIKQKIIYSLKII